MLFTKNRYDALQAKAKKLRTKAEKRNAKDNESVRALNTKIATIKYKREVFNTKINNELTDITSLIINEQNRILKDKIDIDDEDIFKPEVKAEIAKAKKSK